MVDTDRLGGGVYDDMPGSLGIETGGIGTLLTVVPGDTQNTIDATAVPGATSYNLYWLTTPGVTKGTGNKIAGVTFPHVHSSLSNGTTYYYVYTAEDGVSESVESNELSGTPTTPGPAVKFLFGVR